MLNDSIAIIGYGEGLVKLNINTGDILWTCLLDLNPGGYAKPWAALEMIVEGDRLYTLAGNDAVNGARASAVCVSVASGSLIWRHDLAVNESFTWHFSKYSASPDAIFYATQSSHVVALSKATGSVLWDSPDGSLHPVTVGLFQSSPAYRDGVVYVGSGIDPIQSGMESDGCVIALNARDGSVRWKKLLPRPDSTVGYENWKSLNYNVIRAQPVPTAEGIIIEPGFCIALLDTSGRIVWERAPNVDGGLSAYYWPPFYKDGTLYAYNSGNVNFFSSSLDARTGRINWVQAPTEVSVTDFYYPPIMDGDVMYQLSDQLESEVIGQQMQDGKRTLFTSLLGELNATTDGVSGTYLVHNDRLIFMSTDSIICLRNR